MSPVSPGAAPALGRPLAGRRVAVFGLGLSGRAAASLASRLGASVSAHDTRPELALDLGAIGAVAVSRGPVDDDAFVGAETLVVSPGLPAAHPAVARAQAAGVDVVGELGFAARFLDTPAVAITGTNGKSTVTTWTGRLLEAAGLRPFVGGNLGTPLSEAVGGGPDRLVVEVSSYQLELPGAFHPAVAAVLNLTPDHLARHGTMDAYGAAKLAIAARQGAGDALLLPAGDARLARLAEGRIDPAVTRGLLGALPGVRREGRVARVQLGDLDVTLSLAAVAVPGAHHLDHAATAAALALLAGAEPGAVEAALASLRALPHRTEPVHEADGVLWIDDSKATNVDAAAAAIGGLERPAVVLLGGEAKDPSAADYAALAPKLARHRAVVAFGGSGAAVADVLAAAGHPVATLERVDTLEAAVARARALARPGDAVLLSPGGASFDAFRSFVHRGEVFRALARAPSRPDPRRASDDRPGGAP